MNTNSLQQFAWAFFVLMLTTTGVFAQGWEKGNKVQNKQNQVCLMQVSNLSDEQVAAIDKLVASHQETMDEMRQQRRLTANAVEKSEIRTKMLKQVQTHRNEVKELLTEEQQLQYNTLQPSVVCGRNQANNKQRENSNCVKLRRQGNNRNSPGWKQGRAANCIRNRN